MKDKFSFRTISSDVIEYKELHNSLFVSASISNEWIRWYHKDIPDSLGLKTVTYGAYDGDILIGVWSVEPKLMNLEDKEIKVGRCFAVGIHKDYRRLGLFVSLSKFAIKEEIKRGEYDYILGFPQKGRSVIGGHLKAGWEHLQEIDIYSSSSFCANEQYSLSKIEIIKDFRDIKEPSKVNGSFIETPDYRNKRWLSHPDINYICLKRDNSYLVLKPYSNFCHIVDFNGNRKDVYFLLESAKVLAYRHGWDELNLWASENEFFMSEIIEAGYKKGAKHGLPISMISVNINKTSPLLLETCHIQMGVEEGY